MHTVPFGEKKKQKKQKGSTYINWNKSKNEPNWNQKKVPTKRHQQIAHGCRFEKVGSSPGSLSTASGDQSNLWKSQNPKSNEFFEK